MRHPSWKLSTWALLGSFAAGCGASHSHVTWSEDAPHPKEEVFAVRPPPEPPAPSPTADPRAFAARYANPAVCEAAARRLQGASRDEAWDGLKACIEHTPFTQLNALLGRAWAKELSVRPEGAKLIARVVAQRGGSVTGELRYLQEKQIPIFSLTSAMDRPDTYKGRYVLLRAQVADQRSEGARPTVWLVEQALRSVQTDEVVGYGERIDSVIAYSGDVGGRGAVTTAERSGRGTTRRFVENISDETGREALGRLASADPFLETRRDYVILARFDGVRLTSGGAETDDEAPRIPVLTIVSYHAPQALVVY
ncbi:hypothetical protein HV824_04765 [Myxococcus sp. AM009]|uniref:hypothetical protein n=1 Tax=unclassified Myxococcus TaxID=2648731 RepID=UPI0015959FE9|nr:MULTISPECIES: hypothetical protein [unclassified Myxococcus]NVI97432.1 hypothetical protein [Myxococcus sp. AM009]NVJ15134.1 hypothetical protein [Myxococcus sp. AM010]